jgi:hypothetical protein
MKRKTVAMWRNLLPVRGIEREHGACRLPQIFELVRFRGVRSWPKKIKGKKQHILVDTLGLLLHAAYQWFFLFICVARWA